MDIFFSKLSDDGAVLSVDGCCKGDDHAFYPCVDGVESIVEFGYHAPCYGSVSLVSLKVFSCDFADDAVVIVGIA